MRLLASLAIALLAVCLAACGGAVKHGGSASLASKNAAAAGAGSYLNDGDKDEIGDGDGDNNADNDGDARLDHKPDENSNYHDADDIGLLTYGQAASGPVERAIMGVVGRYFEAAAAGNGAEACALLIPRLAGAVPVDYGQHGQPYLRAGKTCAAVMALMFTHSHSQLAAPIAVTGVRVKGGVALALLGSSVIPASYITVQRQRGLWKIAQVLNGPIGV